MCERVFERIFGIGKKACLIEKFPGLKPSDALPDFLLRLIRDGLKEHERNIFPNNGCRLKKTLLLGRQSINPSCQHCLYCRWHLCPLYRSRETIIAPIAHQNFGLHQCPDTLLQKERIPLGTLNQELFKCQQACIVPEQCFEQFTSAFWRQRINAKLAIVGFASPTVPVLRPVIDQQEDTGRRKTLN